ncbi:hypothetical protein G7Y89_g15284 [Cudoniella acicularis]|uniref:Uncharacterized protein n=1 Tax=Cudoniella acicularis TaxID=354080 RepID=A0A8H4QR42_9HELO|nr:hypothetical protein G7Y89_g15284 [Cudoniella acicularis]
MADTPSLPPPLDPREQPILESLIEIRDQLTLLKQDRTTYIKSSDVMPLYEKIIEQVRQLNEIRADKPQEDNQVDRVLDGCFQLLSLFFMTIGRNNEAPASYALTSTIKRLLDHLIEVDLYSEKDLAHVSHTLDKLREILKTADGSHSENFVTLLTHRIEFSTSEVQKLQDQLREIDGQRVDGKFVAANGEVPAGNDEVCDLLGRCLLWSNIVLERKGVFPEAFASKYQILVEIRNKLEKLSLTQAWSLRETDLYDYQRQLDRIDESRVDGNFVDSEGKFAELYVQRTLLYLIRRSYGYIYYLMVSSEPVSEALLPVYNQLQTLRRCLIEVKNSGGVSSPRELYPYSMKLNSIDNMRVDGKFLVGGDIPEGQGSVNELLSECFELSYELRVAAESEPEG